ncbi:MAG: hypothetical protein ACKVVP_18905 [Chloroflexota bacterium]
MNQEHWSTVEMRLTGLERECQWHRRFHGVSLALMGVLAVVSVQAGMAAAQPRVIEAERITLRDGAGVARVEMRVATQGDTSFNINDERGRAVITMGGLGGFAGITMLDADGRERLFMQVGQDALGTDRGPRIGLIDPNGNVNWQAP